MALGCRTVVNDIELENIGGSLKWQLDMADLACVLYARGIPSGPTRKARRFLAQQIRVQHTHASDVLAQLGPTDFDDGELFQNLTEAEALLIEICDQGWAQFLIAAEVVFSIYISTVSHALSSSIEGDLELLHDASDGSTVKADSLEFAQQEIRNLRPLENILDVANLADSAMQILARDGFACMQPPNESASTAAVSSSRQTWMRYLSSIEPDLQVESVS